MTSNAKILSAREREILHYLAKGYTSKKISEELEIAEVTVQTHRRNMLRKLKLNNSNELISWGYQERLLN